jgi:hypothetical protein
MSTELSPTKEENKKVEVKMQGGSSEAVYGLGLIGAWAYYLSRATTLQEGLVGFFKGLFWPAFLVYELLVFLHKE